MTKLAIEEIHSARLTAEDLARYAAAQMIGHRPSEDEISTKANAGDWVTAVDVEIEQHVRDELRRLFPGHGLVGEEFGASEPDEKRGPRWFCDPIDGTTNFVHGFPWSSFSLALADENGIALGVVADPYRDELFVAVRGEGATLNGTPVSCSSSSGLVGGVVLCELNGTTSWDGMSDVMSFLESRQCVTHLLGSSALSLANFGAGRASAVVLGAANPIDVAAGLLIARESGGSTRGGIGVDPVLSLDGSLTRAKLLVATPSALFDMSSVLC